MNDMVSAMIALQRAQLTAAQRMIDAGKGAVAMQEAAQRATRANIAAATAWTRMWGWP